MVEDTGKPRVPARGSEGWFVDASAEGPAALVGARCARCATVAFPPTARYCPNPASAGGEADLARQPLGGAGTVWSYTDARYTPPPPYVVRTDPYEPVALAAVALDGAGLVVLGQVADGFGVADLAVGRRVELVIEPLFEDADTTWTVWRWRPTDPPTAGDAGDPGSGEE